MRNALIYLYREAQIENLSEHYTVIKLRNIYSYYFTIPFTLNALNQLYEILNEMGNENVKKIQSWKLIYISP
jgi:hypothetical protein